MVPPEFYRSLFVPPLIVDTKYHDHAADQRFFGECLLETQGSLVLNSHVTFPRGVPRRVTLTDLAASQKTRPH